MSHPLKLSVIVMTTVRRCPLAPSSDDTTYQRCVQSWRRNCSDVFWSPATARKLGDPVFPAGGRPASPQLVQYAQMSYSVCSRAPQPDALSSRTSCTVCRRPTCRYVRRNSVTAGSRERVMLRRRGRQPAWPISVHIRPRTCHCRPSCSSTAPGRIRRLVAGSRRCWPAPRRRRASRPTTRETDHVLCGSLLTCSFYTRVHHIATLLRVEVQLLSKAVTRNVFPGHFYLNLFISTVHSCIQVTKYSQL